LLLDIRYSFKGIREAGIFGCSYSRLGVCPKGNAAGKGFSELLRKSL
jgi:hypothetical protein